MGNSAKVSEGQIDWFDPAEAVEWHDGKYVCLNVTAEQYYFMTRMALTMAYANLGRKTQSKTAFRLAAENALDMLCITYKDAQGETEFKLIGGWMVSGGMDQEALNFFVYLSKRRYSKKPLPYLDIESNDANIEDPNMWERILNLQKNLCKRPEPACFPEFHLYIIGALLKYKNLQHNLMERRKSIVKWASFLMGTHLEVGHDSPVLKLRGNRTVLEKIQNMVLNKELVKRIINELVVITSFLKRIDQRSQYLIKGLLEKTPPKDREKLIGVPHGTTQYKEAWEMSPAYLKILKNFLETGKIADKGWHRPTEGFFQASVDTDPTKGLEDCSEFNLICFKTGCSIHICKA